MGAKFGFERLDAFRVALALFVAVCELTSGLKGHVAWVIRDQMVRAALSVLLNLLEGNAETHPGERAKFFTYSRRSADEVAGCGFALVAVGLRSEQECEAVKILTMRAIQILVRMIQKTGAADFPTPDPAPVRS